FDTAPATVFQPRVVSKRVRQSKSRGVVSRQPYLKVERWRPKGARQEFRVSRAVYDAYKVGDRLTIELKPGALGIPLYRLRVRSRR
ncbi:MAG: hypothetical protein KDC27_18580, partial [Acidobacteria bacterium]|nr:hypothetical protein [Acidobacteriota bacterium]